MLRFRAGIILIVVFLSISTQAWGQSYSALWKEYEVACGKDLPADAVAILETIIAKAEKGKAYGHLVSAELHRLAVLSAVNPDTLTTLVAEYAAAVDGTTDVALQAVYNATLGHIYNVYPTAMGLTAAEGHSRAKDYFSAAMRSPRVLAKTKARVYEPLTVLATNSWMFNHDLLHVLAIATGEYDVMIDYYLSVGNRPAACLGALYKLRAERHDYDEPGKSQYLSRVDSLMYEYDDLPVCGEVAIEHFSVMDSSTDVSSEEKLAFIDEALVRWRDWERIVVLQNARSRITLPAYHVDLPATVVLPNQPIPVHITSLKNISKITMSVYKVDVSGADSYRPMLAEDYKTLMSKRVGDGPVATDSRTYYGLPEWREVRDTLTIASLPVGTYLIEFTTDNSSIPAERVMLSVTNLRVIDMSLPGDAMRLICVDATTGQPIAKAEIHVKFRAWNDRQWVEDEQVLTTEDDGEVVYTSTITPYQYRVTYGDDVAFPWNSLSRHTWQPTVTTPATATPQVRLFTDRALYRRGQTIEAAVIAYDTMTEEDWQVAPETPVHIALRDAKGTTIAETDAMTDAFGTAQTLFTIPAVAATGYYSLRATYGTASGTAYCRVEDYQRPTFDITIDDYAEGYAVGDTIVVTGMATTFSGVPVANATVHYTVTSQLCSWWRALSASSSVLATCATTTDSDGRFTLTIPIAFPSGTTKGDRFARVVAGVDVTSLSGETHAATRCYPLSDKATALAITGFDDKQCVDDPRPFSFLCVNASGENINDTVRYAIDDGAQLSTMTNTDTVLPLEALSSGSHMLRAVCRGDSLCQPFIVFALADTTSPVDTAAWYFSTSHSERKHIMQQDKAEYIQLGTSREQQTIFYTIATADEVVESGQLLLSNELRTRAFSYDASWGDGLAIRYSWVRDGELYTFSESLAKPVRDCTLDVHFDTFRDQLTPGQDEQWTITITTPDGTPAAAQLLAVLYDKALDAIVPHSYALSHVPSYPCPTITTSARCLARQQYVYGEQSIRYAVEPELLFSHLDIPTFSVPITFSSRALGIRTPVSLYAITPESAALDSDITPLDNSSEVVTTVLSPSVVRENLAETAFFYPQLTTDKQGTVTIHFTLPESVTTWQFLSIAHDRAMNTGTLTAQVLAQKELMITPHLPRFLRQGDHSELTATIANITGEVCTADATITITNPTNSTTVFTATIPCVVPAASSLPVTFPLPATLAEEVYVVDLTVTADRVSDGERHYLPVISNTIPVTTTRAFTQPTASETTIDLTPLYGTNSTDETTTISYTSNPIGLLIDALPVIATPDDDSAIAIATALLVNSIAERVYSLLPDSVRPTMPSVTTLLDKLHSLQNNDGSFSWFNGMRPSPYVTHAVARLLAQQQHRGLATDLTLLTQVLTYLDTEMSQYVKSVETGARALSTAVAIDYLYVQTIAGVPLTAIGHDNAAYLLASVSDGAEQFTIYDKATLAVILAKHPVAMDRDYAETLINSIHQYSVYSPEMGRYFVTPRAAYSWRDYRLPTQTAVIEALQLLTPTDTRTIAEYQQWLLQEKRTVSWDTPINAAEAVYAFFNGVDNVSRVSDDIALFLDDHEIDATSDGLAGTISYTSAGRHTTFTARKSGDNLSWGAVTITAKQPAEEVTADGDYLSIHREILDDNGHPLATTPHVGQRITVRLTITAERDLDFVVVTDHRPACLEPANYLSQYTNGYYYSPQDNVTQYFFDTFAMGKHVIDTDYYVDRAGDYHAGTATVTCAYAPEYSAREGIYNLTTTHDE